jgi:hypothetical protein
MLVRQKVLFYVGEDDANKFKDILKQYWQYLRKKSATEAADLAESSYENLISGKDLVGNYIDHNKLTYFDVFLSEQTDYFYTPTDAQRERFKKGDKPKKKKSRGTSTELEDDDIKKVAKIRENLLSAYPSLERKDLEESIENYCRLIVKINKLMINDAIGNNVAIKNLTETMIKLGAFLGIDEEKKAKQKALEDKQSIASLSSKFQKTIDEYPHIMDRMRYEEIRILLEKLDSQSLGISKELFESPAYAGMTVNKAREFVKEREARYEEKDG